MARFMDKETLYSEADRLGVDLTGLKWPQMQKAVIDAQNAEVGETGPKPSADDAKDTAEYMREEMARLRRQLADAQSAQPQEPVVFDLGRNVEPNTIEDYEGKVVLISPGQKETPNQRVKYDETLGYDRPVKEVHLDVGKNSPFLGDQGTSDLRKDATYQLGKRTGKKVVATSTMPKIGAMLTFDPRKDMVAVATYNGHRGYLWSHHRLPNIKGLLKEAGVYEDYRDRFKNKLFYVGMQLCCDISYANSILSEVSRKARINERAGLE